jgi:hypothetical protein
VQDQLNDQLSKADHAPVYNPAGTNRVEDGESCHISTLRLADHYGSTASRRPAVEEDDEEAQLKQLQAELAMPM